MRFWNVFRFELAYQLRRVPTWLFFAALVVVTIPMMVENAADAQSGGYFANAPLVIATVSLWNLLWLVVTAAVSGEAAARDVRTRMDPLTYTAPVSKAAYLGGRFLAAFVLNAIVLLALPAGILLALQLPGIDPELIGPFRPAAYLGTYAVLVLPNVFVATALQFSLAALSRQAVAAYLGSVFLLVVTSSSIAFVAEGLGLWELARLVDPIGVAFIHELSMAWTPLEKNTHLIGLQGSLLANRLLWMGVALAILAFTYRRFRFLHPAASAGRRRIRRRRDAYAEALEGTAIATSTPVSIPPPRREFGWATHARQTLAVAGASFRAIATSRGAIIFSVVITLFGGLFAAEGMAFMGVPLIARTEHVLYALTTPEAGPGPWLLIPLFIVFWAGELVWREREAGLSEMVDAAPLPEWALFAGKFLGLALLPVACMALLLMVGVLLQLSAGYHDLQVGLYGVVLFGLQLPNYLFIACLALVLHVGVNQKHVGLLAIFLTLFSVVFAIGNGIGHHLLIPGSAPGWFYTDMRGFGGTLGPWLWFKLYWAEWALLLGVGATLLWVRGEEGGLRARLRLARLRLTRPAAWTAGAALGLILMTGGFIFYNTNILNDYTTAADGTEQRAEYERRYGRYEGTPQPRLTSTSLQVEIYPERRAADLRGTYRLVNDGAEPIDTVHLATTVPPREVEFDPPATPVLADEELGHRIYALAQPLPPGDSLRIDFAMGIEPHGFRNSGVDASVASNGTFVRSYEWLPAIGYQRNREIRNAGERRARGLAPQPEIPPLDDVGALRAGAEGIAFDAIVGTDQDQIAIAPGALRRTWTEGGRRYFHYVTDAPIGPEHAFFSADYAVREGQWNGVAIRVFHHPEHTAHPDRTIRSVQASLAHYTEQFGPYPYDHIRLVEHPGHGGGMHAEANTIDHEEAFTLLNPREGPDGLDLPFFVVAHEVAHQWWGYQLTPARAEGAGLLVESLASYSAYQVLEDTHGIAQLHRLLDRLRISYQVPRTRAAAPLLRANDAFLYYRKGPFAMYALSRYLGRQPVNTALRRLLEQHRSGAPPLATSLDLYRELQAVTPDSLRGLLHDLFEANIFWEFATERAVAEQTAAGTWQVTLDVRSRKVVVDSVGRETELPLDDWVEIGVFAPAGEGDPPGEPLYTRMHRIRSAEQTITVTVPREPARAGVDPYHLLIEVKTDDNVADVAIGS